MSYLVMECRRSYAVLLDQEGRFVKAANLRYEVGQTVFDPVLLEEPAPKLKLLPWIGGGAAGLAALAAALVFAVILPLYHQAVDVYSSIYLTINPQVQMDLNHAGDVVELTGTNRDGVLLLEGYDYTGKDRLTVADELVDRAIDMGFLEDGGTVNFSIDTPEESLFQEYGMELRDEVTHHLEGRVAVEVQVVHYSQEEVETMAQATPAATPTPTPAPLPRLPRRRPPRLPQRPPLRLPPHRRPRPPTRTRITAPAATASPTTPRLPRHSPKPPAGIPAMTAAPTTAGTPTMGEIPATMTKSRLPPRGGLFHGWNFFPFFVPPPRFSLSAPVFYGCKAKQSHTNERRN